MQAQSFTFRVPHLVARVVRARSVLVAAALLACALLTLPHAHAQAMGVGVRSIPVRALDGLSTVLALDSEQSAQLRVLHEGYQAARRKVLEEAASERDEALKAIYAADGAKPEDIEAKQKAVGEVFKSTPVKLKQAEDEFLDNVQALLTAEQQASWANAERWLRRFDASRFGLMAGAMADVSQLASDVGLDRTGDVAGVLDRYETEVDGAIQGWNASVRNLSDMMGKAMTNPMGEPEGAEKIIRELFTASHKVREVNRRAVRELVDLSGGLSDPESKGARLHAAFLAKSYPLTYGERRVDRIMAKFQPDGSHAGKLSEEQRSEVAILTESHQRDIALVRTRLARAIDETQEWMMTKATIGQDPSEAVGPAFGDGLKDRDALETRSLERLKAIVGEELFEDASTGIKNDPKGRDTELMGDFSWLKNDTDG